MNNVHLTVADTTHAELLLPLVREYHEFEHISVSDAYRKKALLPLLAEESTYGRVWIIEVNSVVVGYIALCFGYSIELCGRDAFIDEFFLKEEFRGQGIGGRVLELVKRHARSSNVAALHLEVAKTNEKAKKLYAKSGFSPRDRYHIMSCSIST